MVAEMGHESLQFYIYLIMILFIIISLVLL